METVRKALVPLVAAVAAILTQLLATGEFNLTGEGVTALFGVVTAVVVWKVPNVLAPGLASVRKALVPLGTGLVALVVQYAATGEFSDTQEVVTAVTGVLTALFVYWVPNAGQYFEQVASGRRVV